MSKEYGLIIPGKKAMVVQAPGKRAAIFDEDSDSDDKEFAKPTFCKPMEKKQTKISHDKAVEEDPTVYQYDEIYDDMEKKRNESKLSRKDLEKKPKYINNLLRAAERRKRENERRIERQVQKEREAEGDEFKDKESYVTPSYQKKLEEMKALEEKEKREEYLESIGDVRKQGNLDGFYRHLYDQKVNYDDKVKVENEEELVEEKKSDEIINKRKSSSEGDEGNTAESSKRMKKSKRRQYRARDESCSEEETLKDEVKKEHIPSNLDADSDFSIDSSDSEEEKSSELLNTSNNNKTHKDPNVVTISKTPDLNDVKLDTNSTVKQESVDGSVKSEKNDENAEKTLISITKPKIDIWKKRTVGEIFEAARKRYFERLSQRESG